MGPTKTRADWQPGCSFSEFAFGASIAEHVKSGFVYLVDRAEIAHPLLKSYWCEELGCFVSAMKDVIHQVTCLKLCSFKGYNLIGTERDRIVQLLAPSNVNFHILTEPLAENDEPAMCFVSCPELGLVGDMPIATNAMYSVELFGADADHARRASAFMLAGNDNIAFDIPR